MLTWIALGVAIVAVAQVARVRKELAVLRAELLEVPEPGGPWTTPAASPTRAPAGPGVLTEEEYRLLEQFLDARERVPGETRDRVADRLTTRFEGRFARAGRAPEEFLLALYHQERAERSAETAEPAETVEAQAPAQVDAPAEALSGAHPAPSSAAPTGARGLDLETLVGTTWALRLGLGALAIAVALFARSVVPSLPAAAKVALAYGGAVALFVVGRVFEGRQERFGRPVMAGALAIGFFVSFASHFVPAMRAVPLVPALAWMALGVVAVLVLAERWGSEPTAGMAIFLGHVSAFVAGGVTDVYSLVVILFLSAAAAVLLWRHDWLPLSLFAVTAAYASHLLWSISDRGPAAAGLGVLINLIFLASYYGIFLGADLLWWRRDAGAAPGAPAGSAAGSRAGRSRALARALGPTNLVLLATLATFLYLAAPERSGMLPWFFFGLGALQIALTPLYRRLGNPDHVFYPALGAVLITLGFAAALDGLSLNLVLALEAVALLVAAHTTRLRVFHFLAQTALAANFVHYWMAARYDDPTLPFYVGGLAIAAAYLTQATLEEVWYGTGREGGGWRRNPRPAGAPGWLAGAFDRGFGRIAPTLAYLHAGAGAVLVAHQSYRYLGPRDALIAMAVGVVLIAAAGVARRSPPLVLASATLQGAIAVLAVSSPPPGSWLLALTAVGLGLPFAVAATARARGFTPTGLRTTLVLTQLAVLTALFLALIPFSPGAGTAVLTTYLAWILVLSLVGVYLETGRAALAGLGTSPSPDLLAAARFGAGLSTLLAATGVILATQRLMGVGLAAPVWTTAWGAALIAAAAWRRQPAFTLAALLLIVFGDWYWLVGRGLDDVVLRSTLATTAIAGVPLAVGVLLDRLGTRPFVGTRPGLAAAATYLPYLMGSAIVLAWCNARLPEAWAIVMFAALPAALVLATARGRARRGANVGALLMLLALGDRLGYAVTTSASGLGDLLAPGLLLAAAALALERVLAADDPARTTPVGASRAVRLTLLAVATLLAMATTHTSWWLGGPRTTVGWSLIGGALMGAGFAAKSADHRRVALAVLGVAAVRVFAVDTRGLSDTAKTLAFLVLGLALVAVAWLYSRFGRRLRDWL